MPIYEYCCTQCNHTFEDLVKAVGVKEVVVCPECDDRSVMRLPSVFGVGPSGVANAPTGELPVCGACGNHTDQPCSPSEV